jgi:ABC-type uncharacterized transport system auxiliary subunit
MTARALFRVSLLAFSALLAACVGSLLESKQPVDTIYVLAPPPPATSGEALPIDLAIAPPRLAPGLGTARIAVLKGRELNYYSGARWGSDLSQLTQHFLVRTLEGQGAFRSVAPTDMRIAGEYVLDVEVTHFQAEYTGTAAAAAHVAYTGKLLRVADRSLVDTIATDITIPAATNRLSAVIAAFEQAAQRASAELGEKVAASARADLATRTATAP